MDFTLTYLDASTVQVVGEPIRIDLISPDGAGMLLAIACLLVAVIVGFLTRNK